MQLHNILNSKKNLLIGGLVIIVIYLFFRFILNINYTEFDDITGINKLGYNRGEIGVQENYTNKLTCLQKNTYTPQGFSLPLEPSYADNKSNMFMFANNNCKPECCPSTYSCSGGCICVTKKQNNLLSGRGNNNDGTHDGIN